MMGVCASKPGGEWVKDMLDSYNGRHFVIDGQMDLTTNVSYLTRIMNSNGLVQNGKEQYYKDLHIYPVDYFCPKQTTGEYFKTINTYCESIGTSSWMNQQKGLKEFILSLCGANMRTRIIKLKRKLLG